MENIIIEVLNVVFGALPIFSGSDFSKGRKKCK